MRRIESEALIRTRRPAPIVELPQATTGASPIDPVAIADYFDAIFCINLAHRTDRWTKMSDAFARHAMTVTRVDAVDGRDLPRGTHESGGAVGCALSHAKVHEAILSLGCSRALVLEDDVLVPDDLPLRIGRLAASGLEWDAIILGRSAGGWGAFAYGVTPAAAAIMLPRLASAEIPADHVLLRELPHRARVAEHPVFQHDYNMGSNIHPLGRR